MHKDPWHSGCWLPQGPGPGQSDCRRCRGGHACRNHVHQPQASPTQFPLSPASSSPCHPPWPGPNWPPLALLIPLTSARLTSLAHPTPRVNLSRGAHLTPHNLCWPHVDAYYAPPLPQACTTTIFSHTWEHTKMRNWLVNKFASLSFNKCPHQPLPAMPGPPMEITIDPKARAYVTRRPANTPLHWKEEISSQLKRDEALGVIERVPPNTPVTWMHRTVYTPKADGSPRRTVDLQSLNKYCVRDIHHCIPPAQQARSVPPNTVRTVLDAWNGFHSIEIREEDRHLTTFLTEEGKVQIQACRYGIPCLTRCIHTQVW